MFTKEQLFLALGIYAAWAGRNFFRFLFLCEKNNLYLCAELIDKHKMVIGYTTGVFDLFHIGHLTLLKNAKGLCDKLIVGVTVDELVLYKGKHAMIPYSDRAEIVRSVKYVDAVVPQYDMDKLAACKKLGATVLFVGDDWYGTEKWKKYEEDFAKEGIKIVYFPYTKGISSTKITEALKLTRGWVDGKEVEHLKESHLND